MFDSALANFLTWFAIANLMFIISSDVRSQTPSTGNSKTEIQTVSKREDSKKVYFEDGVGKILENKCGQCHGKKKNEAKLILTSPEGISKGSESGAIIFNSNPTAGRLFEVINSGEMPPEDAKQLSKSEKAKILNWIRTGANFRNSISSSPVYEHRIIALLHLRCTVCHGAQKQEGKLDLRTRESMLKGGNSGPAIISKKPQESLILKQIHSGKMPPRRKLVEASIKVIEDHETKLLEKWIQDGLPQMEFKTPEPTFSDSDRAFWSFKTPQKPSLPKLKNKDLEKHVFNPIDRFVLKKLEEKGLEFAPKLDRIRLLRRLSYDLRGLPPSPAEIEQFKANTDPNAFSEIIDQFLASPRYGEKWARMWLDVAGYSDSEGGQNEDRARPNMWRYRDYVVRAFNNDKPYSDFVREQIGGDELVENIAPQNPTMETYEKLVATGFLRTAPDRTFADITNFVPERLELIAHEMQIFSSAMLGLTVQCARCHSHKFDPISQRDYYQLTAIFKDALDEHDWLKPQTGRYIEYGTPTEILKYRQTIEKLEAEIKTLESQIKYADEAAKKEIQTKIDELKKQRPSKPRIRALWSRGRPSPSYVYTRGNYLTPGAPVQPNVPEVLTNAENEFEPVDFRTVQFKPVTASSVNTNSKLLRKTGHRLALAKWLTSSKHPLTARVIVNRIWKHHFGRGIVRTLDNFGKTGAPPTHPELLDWLATEFMKNGWSIKWLHRTILTSRTYQQSSATSETSMRKDPDGRWLSRMPIRRLEAEELRDSLLATADQLSSRMFGSPDSVQEKPGGLIVSERSKVDAWRRSIYVISRRTKIPTLLDNFDFPSMGPNCIERRQAIVAPQALHLLNDKMVRQLSDFFADRVISKVDSPKKQVEMVYEIAFGRPATKLESEEAIQTLKNFEELWQVKVKIEPEKYKRGVSRLALSNFCHAMINSAEFVYID